MLNNKSKRLEIKIGGVGGQGVVYAANFLGLALSYKKGHVSVSISYGPESRGSLTTSELVFSEKPIDYPHVEGIDILVAMHQLAYTKLSPNVRETGFILIDSFYPAKGKKPDKSQMAPCRHYFIPASNIAQKEIGDITMANIILCGAIIQITKLTNHAEAIQALKQISSPQLYPLSEKALIAGLSYNIVK